MKLRELRELLNNPLCGKHLEDTVSIILSEPSVGGCSKSGVESIQFGFDWDANHLLIVPDVDLIRRYPFIKSENKD